MQSPPPEIEDYNGVLYTLFQLEELYGLTIGEIDGAICLKLDGLNKNGSLTAMLKLWNEKKEKLSRAEITQEEHDLWCKRYPLSHAEESHKSLRARRKGKKED